MMSFETRNFEGHQYFLWGRQTSDDLCTVFESQGEWKPSLTSCVTCVPQTTGIHFRVQNLLTPWPPCARQWHPSSVYSFQAEEGQIPLHAALFIVWLVLYRIRLLKPVMYAIYYLVKFGHGPQCLHHSGAEPPG